MWRNLAPVTTRRDYSRRPKDPVIAFPAVVLDYTILERLGLIWGTRPNEVPPKVVMNRSEWGRLVAAIHAVTDPQDPTAAHRAIGFLGKTWLDNPLIERPSDAPPERRPRKRKPSPFAYLKKMPAHTAIEMARQAHAKRMAGGMDEEESLVLLGRSLQMIRRAEEKRLRGGAG